MNIRFGVTLGKHVFLLVRCYTPQQNVTILYGIIAVGPAGAGKTTSYQTLANVLTALRDSDSPNKLYQKV